MDYEYKLTDTSINIKFTNSSSILAYVYTFVIMLIGLGIFAVI